MEQKKTRKNTHMAPFKVSDKSAFKAWNQLTYTGFIQLIDKRFMEELEKNKLVLHSHEGITALYIQKKTKVIQ